MEIILLQSLDKVGEKHEIVEVKNGYGRNFLIPQGLAIIANSSNKRRLAEMRRIEQAQQSKLVGSFEEMAAKLVGQVIKIEAKAGTSGKIFGSVNNMQIAQVLKEKFDLEIDRRKIEILDDVKELGSYKAKITFHPEVISEIDFDVIEG
ncbi:MAG: 50S ribosomal protein L9 [Saprospiraceae bacterium]|nr:50S ribosomal protein L9 [Saprospiraceae bacterium]